jgi:mRNA interferase RelE/StbE|tara:strand:- start:42 stop:296 length:255 start_codon:yes stop_codon:yes gene_type:complete
MFEVVFDDNAIDFLTKLPKELRKRIYSKVISTKENPFRYFERLEGRMDYKLRVGDYRVVADINRNSKKIEVTLIGHRKNVYKNL